MQVSAHQLVVDCHPIVCIRLKLIVENDDQLLEAVLPDLVEQTRNALDVTVDQREVLDAA